MEDFLNGITSDGMKTVFVGFDRFLMERYRPDGERLSRFINVIRAVTRCIELKGVEVICPLPDNHYSYERYDAYVFVHDGSQAEPRADLAVQMALSPKDVPRILILLGTEWASNFINDGVLEKISKELGIETMWLSETQINCVAQEA